MGKEAETPGKPATHRVQVLLNDDDKAALDAQKGHQSASAYVRDLIRRGLAHNALRVSEGATTDHDHTKGKLLSTYTVGTVTTNIYRCTGCAGEIEERNHT